MLVKNIADHFRPRIQEHVISKRRRPIGNREPRALAGDEAADKEERKGRAAKDYREPMGPQPAFNKGDYPAVDTSFTHALFWLGQAGAILGILMLFHSGVWGIECKPGTGNGRVEKR